MHRKQAQNYKADINQKLNTIIAIVALKIEEIFIHIFIIKTISKIFKQQKQNLP